jgi:hypothetical protein
VTTNLEDLGAALDACVYHLGQSIAAIERSRTDAINAGRMMAQTTEGSVDDGLSDAMVMVAEADRELEDIAARYVKAVEKIREYKSSRGIA